MAQEAFHTQGCEHCNRVFVHTPGGTNCPHCRKAVPTPKATELTPPDGSPEDELSAQARPGQRVVCIDCGGDRLKRVHCKRCEGTGAHGWPYNPTASSAPAPQHSRSAIRITGKPSDHRPEGAAVCHVCSGRGSTDNRSCSRCSGRGYLGAF